MTDHRRLRMLGFALAAAAAWAIAPGAATADDHRHERGDRYEHYDRDRGDRYGHLDHDRSDRYKHRDRWERKHRRSTPHRFDRKHDTRRHDRKHDARRHGDRYQHRGPHRGFARHDSHGWLPPRYARPRPHRFHRHARSAGSWPYYCRDHRHGFRHRSHFDDHLVRFHHLPHGQLPRLVAQIGFGWTFGY